MSFKSHDYSKYLKDNYTLPEYGELLELNQKITYSSGISKLYPKEENAMYMKYPDNAETILNLIEKQDKMIDLMAEYIGNLDIDEDICKKRIDDCYVDMYDDKACKDCVKDFFRNIVKGEKE